MESFHEREWWRYWVESDHEDAVSKAVAGRGGVRFHPSDDGKKARLMVRSGETRYAEKLLKSRGLTLLHPWSPNNPNKRRAVVTL